MDTANNDFSYETTYILERIKKLQLSDKYINLIYQINQEETDTTDKSKKITILLNQYKTELDLIENELKKLDSILKTKKEIV
jgi:hypothetical protein